ncbi:hypothetical protein NESM_000775400 [Novymonas esmeraldas]|uniref:Uncharacterized protein n=1 Tax=Novymonas esmeraldas TaxID=1808958 RepID=A0AAW0EXJ2_9TRYP
MRSRVPLRVAFSAEGRRHTIPHRTFSVAVALDGGHTHASAESTVPAEEGLAFFRYLDSDDTRMPSHPHLSSYAHPAEEYETYVGEEVWDEAAPAAVSSTPCTQPSPRQGEGVGGGGAASKDTASRSASEDAVAPVPSFDGVVGWVNRLFDEENWAADGVVLCGRYVVADDGAWVVPSRSPTLYTTREVFLLMRNSSKFLHDVHTQMRDLEPSAAQRGTHSHVATLEFTLAKSLAGSGASEMRAILPYPLHYHRESRAWVLEDTAASLSFTGVGQRVTDACFPSLMAWTEVEHDANFRLVQRRIEQAALLERTCAADAAFISRLVAAFERQRRRSTQSAAEAAESLRPSPPRLALLLSVDVLFDGPALPIYVLSARARVFEVAPRSSAPWAALLAAAPQWDLWTPLLVGASDAGSDAGGDCSGDTCAAPSAEREAAASESGSEEEEEEGEATATLNFFRMFRDVPRWNQYVAAMVERLQRVRSGPGGREDSNKPSRGVQHYCVIASESADLVTCSDTLTKRGLPLELMHPELLEANEEAATFLKMLRDGLFKRPEGSS